jgi:hypothetical protein
MPGMAPEDEAVYALNTNIPRERLQTATQLVYDRLKAERDARLPPAKPPARTSPEVRAQITEIFKWTNNKYAKPFEKGHLAGLLLSGGDEYGQVVLQMAILDTLLSIEEHLTSIEEHLTSDGRSEPHSG